jgi:hypothetical protein
MEREIWVLSKYYTKNILPCNPKKRNKYIGTWKNDNTYLLYVSVFLLSQWELFIPYFYKLIVKGYLY